MGAFRDLLQEAHALGQKSVSFECDLDAFFGADPEYPSWWAVSKEPFHVANGRTGEEALRSLVEKLK